ncbi:cytochrome c oxidase subunit II [Roseovarius sp. EL26]|uniref:cytochrome c oxidase subunit II n=1 Tax=Roseovarius sp. EL26 TaxID=2126672 RepID=UPI000EA3DD48|nr:cytochrome c oxidase subunit II [Roseovarius sp. EL26]
MRRLSSLLAIPAALTAIPAFAQDNLEVLGTPKDGGIAFQPAVTELASDINWLDGMVLAVITIIVLFVCALMAICIVRYNRKANPTPSTFTHNSPIEVAWTIIPIIVLILIGSFSLPILFKQQEIPEGEIHIKVTGNQWNWTYEYPEHELEFTSYLVDGAYEIDDEAAGWGSDQPMSRPQVLDDVAVQKLEYFGYSRDEFLLATDTAVIVPVNKVVVMTVTGSDVIHSWTIPAFGVKQDAVPGRLAQLWFKAEKEGVYFGQCSELCGKDHAYMPITVKVVSEETYEAWLKAVADNDNEYVDTAALN